MRNELYIKPRQSGKTTEAIRRFIKRLLENKETYLIVYNSMMKKEVIRILTNCGIFLDKAIRDNYIINIGSLSDYINDDKEPTQYKDFSGINDSIEVIVDEYFFFQDAEQKALYSFYKYLNRNYKDVTFALYSSFNRRYGKLNKNVVNMITELKQKFNHQDIEKMLGEKYKWLLTSFLTEPLDVFECEKKKVLPEEVYMLIRHYGMSLDQFDFEFLNDIWQS